MFNRLFPPSLTNAYQGSWLALWLLVPVLLIKTVMGFNFSGLNPFVEVTTILQTVDGVPMDTFSEKAASTVISLSKAWGVALVTLCFAVWLIIARYRSALPIAILLLLVEQLGRTGLSLTKLVSRVFLENTLPSPSGYINLGLTIALLTAFILAVFVVRKPRA
jgi:hypothetical protein